MKIVSLVDSSADFIQATALGRTLRRKHYEILVHTGPHTEFFQARAYFEHVDLLEPEVNLEIGSASHNGSLGELLNRLERILLELHPDLVIVRGDSDAALAAALVAARRCIPLARLEAGPVDAGAGRAEEAPDHLAVGVEDRDQHRRLLLGRPITSRSAVCEAQLMAER